MSSVPDEPIIENIEFVDEGRIDVVLSSTNNPPSDYCIQFKSEGDDVLRDYVLVCIYLMNYSLI